MTAVYILGGSQSDFARNIEREGESLFELFRDALTEGLCDARLEAREIGVCHAGNFVSDLFTGQAHLGGFFAEADSGFYGTPTTRHEAACASGSMAVMAAMADIESGRYETACVLGIEQMKNVSGEVAADNLAAAAWRGHESVGARFLWPAQFAELLEEYRTRYGLDRSWLQAISENAFSNAKRNPLAQTRNWTITEAHLGEDDEMNPLIEGQLRKQDCGQVTDGAAVVVLANEAFTRDWCKRYGQKIENIPKIAGWGHAGAPLRLASKLEAGRESPFVFPHVNRAVSDALSRAGLSGADALDGIELHDCFSITAYMLIDHLGLAPAGEAWRVIEQGISPDSSFAVNPSGGLIGLGHPVGATGVRMLRDAARQVAGTAGEIQVDGARTMATLNVGGSTTTVASFVVTR